MRRLFPLCFLFVLGCQRVSSPADIAELAKAQLKKEGIEGVLLTPTNETNPLIFQAEGTRNGKSISGSVEVDSQANPPIVKINVFEVPTAPAPTVPATQP
jgi:hypothetical protein